MNPDWKKSKFLIAGEGLAGQVIPLVAKKIFAGNEFKKVGDNGFINLTSILLGNAMLEETSNSDFWEHYHTSEFFDYHGLYGP